MNAGDVSTNIGVCAAMIHDLCSGHREPRSGAGDVCISGLGLGRAGFPYDHLEMEKVNVRVAQLLVAACRQVLVVTSSSGGNNSADPNRDPPRRPLAAALVAQRLRPAAAVTYDVVFRDYPLATCSSLIPQRFDGVQPRSLPRRIEAEDHPDRGRNGHGGDDRRQRRFGGPVLD